MLLQALLFAFLAAGLSLPHATTTCPSTAIGQTNLTHIAKFTNAQHPWLLDTDRLLKSSTFKMKPAELIARAKEVIDNGIFLAGYDGSDMAATFTFQFPIIGPLSKKEYLDAVAGFDLQKAFPDQQPSVFYDFRVDPFIQNRVWFTSVFSALHSGDGNKLLGKATFRHVTTPPQTLSLTFDEQGMVKKLTGGYVMDKELGNSGGLGGFFGVLYAIEARPYRPSIKFRIFSLLQRLLAALEKK